MIHVEKLECCSMNTEAYEARKKPPRMQKRLFIVTRYRVFFIKKLQLKRGYSVCCCDVVDGLD